MREKTAAVGDLGRSCDLPATMYPVTHWFVLICVLFLAASTQPSLAAVALSPRTHTAAESAFGPERGGKDPGSALPPSATILYGKLTTWDRYGIYVIVIVGLMLILVQALAITGLLLRRARARKGDLNPQASEEGFRLMADATPALVWMCDKDG